MLVTDKQYYLDKRLVEKLDLLIDRCSGKRKKDVLMLIDGDEGEGKSTLASLIGYYVAYKTGRPYNVRNFFFDLNKMLEFAGTNSDQIIIWDESALGGLSTQGYTKVQTKLLQLLMVARKKRHFFIFNIPRFYRLKEPIIDRAIALVHVYAQNEIKTGFFTYYKRKQKDFMFVNWRSKKKVGYRHGYAFKGKFGNAMEKVINIEKYEMKKDLAIMNLVKESPDKYRAKFVHAIYLLKEKGVRAEELAIHFKTHKSNIYDLINEHKAIINAK